MTQSSTSPHNTNRARPGSFILLLLTVIAFLMMTYSGRAASTDTIRIMDAISSLANFGDTYLDETAWQSQPSGIVGEWPFSIYEQQESLIVAAGVPLYWLAERLPDVGLVHTTRLLNILLTAFIAGLFYMLALKLGYAWRTAIVTALLLVAATILWPYSKTLFRGILVAFWLLLAALSLLYWRDQMRRVWLLLIALLCVIAAFFTKNSSIVALPALIVLSLPPRLLPQSIIRVMDILLITGWTAILLLAVFPSVLSPLLAILPLNTDFVGTALYAYLLSPGGSFWGTSPVLLLAVPGAWWMIRAGQRPIVWAVALLLAAYAAGHALLTGVHWFGGLSWPPRFLIPIIPFVMLPVLPVIDRLWQARVWRGWGWLAGLLIVYSVGVQTIAAISWQDAYFNLLPAQANGLAEWLPGLTQPQYWRWILLPQSWDSVGFDTAWTRSGQPSFIFAFALAALILFLALVWRWHPNRLALPAVIGVALLLIASLQALYHHDRLYQAHREHLHTIRETLLNQASASDVLLLAGNADVTYEKFIANTFASDTIRPVVLGFQPGERTSPQDTPRNLTAFWPEPLAIDTPRIIDHLANNHDRIWWLAHNSLFQEWSIRPEERYLSANYYLLREITTPDPDLRLLSFYTAQAPSRDALRLPEITTDLRFGDHIALDGVTLPSGTEYQAGDVVPVTFFWRTGTALDTNYTVAWFIASADDPARLVQGVDSMPDANFSPMTAWLPDQLVYDNRAIQLPQDWPAGEYQLWVRLYPTGTDGSVALPVSGGDALSVELAVLPVTLTVSP